MIRRLAKWLRDERAVVAPVLALSIVPIIGFFALGGEVASWYMKQRQLQNVADSAAIAAATNASTGYATEATALATQYGFLAGSDLTITKSNTATCPGTASNTCYEVTIVQKVPLYLTQIVGYTGGGTTMADGRLATSIRATAIATGKVSVNYCFTGIGTGPSAGGGGTNGPNVNLNGGGAGSDFTQCAARTNGTVKCTSLDFAVVQAPDQQGASCGSDFSQTTTTFTDPYASRGYSAKIAAAIAGAPCAPAGTLTGTITATVTKVCAGAGGAPYAVTGNVILAGNGTDPPILVVYDTTLNAAGFSLSTSNGAGAKGGTLIFTGAGTTNLPAWFSSNSGPISIQGASGGDFDDIAIIADPKFTTTADFDPGGGSHIVMETLGTIYAPSTNIVVSGSMDSTIGSYSCTNIIAKSVYVNGGSLQNNPLNCKTLGFVFDETTIQRASLAY